MQAVRRILRHAIAHHIFQEPRKGFVAHTAASKLLATDSLLNDCIGFLTEEMWPSATKVQPWVSRDYQTILTTLHNR